MSALFLCLTCCHGAAVAACCASCFFDVDPCWCDAHSLPLPRRWSRPTRVRSFIGRAGSTAFVTTRAPENTRSSNDGDGSGDGNNGSAASALEDNPHLLSHSCSLFRARSRSLRFCNALALFNTPLALLHTLVYVTELSRVTQSTFLRSVARW